MSTDSAGTYGENFGVEFQDHILAVAMRTPGFVIRYRSAIHHTYFMAELARIVSKVLFDHIDRFRQLPLHATLIEGVREVVDKDMMPDAEKYLKQLYKRDISDAKIVMRKAIDFGKQQAMVNAVMDAAEKIDQGRPRDVMPTIRNAMMVGEDILDVGINYAESAESRAHWYEVQTTDDVVPTGIPHLDYALGGGPSRGELYVLLAPPKRGKTTALINIGFGGVLSALGFNVVHYSCEIRDKKIARRYDDRLAGNLVKTRNMEPTKYIEKLTRMTKKFIRGQLYIKSYPTRSASVSTLRSHLSLLAGRGFNPDVIIVDYADILRPERRIGEMRHEQAGIYEDLREMAGEYNAVCWTASQAKVGALEKDTIDMSDFAEAFEKAAIMDGGIGFCQTQDEKARGECRLVLIGLRGEEDGRVVTCRIRRDRCLLKSKALFDVADSRLLVPGLDSDDDDDAQMATVTRIERSAARRKLGMPSPKTKKKPFKRSSGKVKKGPRRKKGPQKRLDLSS